MKARHIAEYVLLRALLTAVLSLGLPGANRVAEAVGDLVYRHDRRHRRRALRNLEAALPELSVEKRERIARSAFRSFVRTVVEAVYISRVIRKSTVERHIEIRCHPAAREVIARGGGAVICTAHIGSWEVAGAGMSFQGIKLTSVARPIDNPLLDRFVIATREQLGQRIIMKQGAPREMSRALKRKEVLAVLVDQNMGRHGIFVEFFGRPASTTPAPAALALRRGVPVLPMWSRRVGRGFRIVITMESPLTMPATGDRDTDVRELTQAITSRVEAWVREEPGQWLWGHRRWKAKPVKGSEEWKPSPSI